MSRIRSRSPAASTLRWLLGWLLSGCAALAAAAGENEVKAAYVLNFARYIEWPADSFATASSPIILCIGGREPFAGALAPMEGRAVQGREVRLRRGAAPEDLKGCHILLISDAEDRRLPVWLKSVPPGVLTVSEIDGFVEAGGAIGLVVQDERIRFDVNAAALAQASLKASANMLKVARTVSGLRR